MAATSSRRLPASLYVARLTRSRGGLDEVEGEGLDTVSISFGRREAREGRSISSRYHHAGGFPRGQVNDGTDQRSRSKVRIASRIVGCARRSTIVQLSTFVFRQFRTSTPRNSGSSTWQPRIRTS